jgi:hypothetical protein
MTCAECQDLLLELSYGELDAARAAEVEEHARSCVECAAALAELSRTRTLVGAVSEIEEPPASLDARILEAARTEAVILGDGTQGPVISADVRVQPLAVEAAQIDPRANVKVPARRERRRWALRAALAGSVATAAGLAVAISTRAPTRVAPRTDESEYRIEVRTADEAHRAAAASAAADEAHRAAAASAAADEAHRAGAASAAAQKKPDRAEPAQQPSPAPAPTATPPAPSTPAKAPQSAPSAPPSDLREAAGRPSVSSPPAKPAAEPQAEAPQKMLAQSDDQLWKRSRRMASDKAATGASAASGALSESQPAADPAGLEVRAEATRRQGAFGGAAALYQEASRARAASGDAAAASWDLAHAVECLAAAGRFAEARAGRAELRSLYPDAQGALAATDRALRTAPAAGDAPASDRAGPR